MVTLEPGYIYVPPSCGKTSKTVLYKYPGISTLLGNQLMSSPAYVMWFNSARFS